MTSTATLLRLARSGELIMACALVGQDGRPLRVAAWLAGRYPTRNSTPAKAVEIAKWMRETKCQASTK